MGKLVDFYCPSHGWRVGAPEHALVECGKCGDLCSPAGVTPQQQRKRYLTARRVRKHRDSR